MPKEPWEMSPAELAMAGVKSNGPTPSPYAKPGPYVTQLSPSDETQFQSWVKNNNIPWQDSPTSDYDMRGFWKAQQSGDLTAKRAANLHFPDTYKTPYHATFSNESKYATSQAPHWEGDQLIDNRGKVVADETPQKEPWEMTPGQLALAGQQGPNIPPSLMASRQAASKSEFEANLPPDPGFIRGLTKSVASIPVDVGNMVASGAEKVRQAVDPYGFIPQVPQVPESAKYAVTSTGPMDRAGKIAGTVGMAAAPIVAGAGAAVRALSAGADQPTIAAIKNIRKLNPTTAEAQATAGRIASEALQRGSVPEASNLAVRDSRVFSKLLDAQTELQKAKAATPLTQQAIDGKKLLQSLDSAISQEQVPAAVNPQYGNPTTSAQGGAYNPITSFSQGDPVTSGRVQGLTNVRNQIAQLVDNNGNIRADKLQQFKEIIDKNIFDHSGWKDAGTAADKANLQALRDGNGYVRQALRDLGNKDLNTANDTYSHASDVAKIVDIRRPDLAGLDTANKVRAALVPIKGTPAEQFVRATARKVAPYAIPAAGVGIYEAFKNR